MERGLLSPLTSLLLGFHLTSHPHPHSCHKTLQSHDPEPQVSYISREGPPHQGMGPVVLILQRSSHPLLFLPHSSSLFISPHLILVCKTGSQGQPCSSHLPVLRNSRIQDYCEVARKVRNVNWGSSGVLLSPGALFPWTLVYGHVVSKYRTSEIICHITPSNHHRQIFFPSWQVPAVQLQSFEGFRLTGCTLAGQAALASIAGESGGTWYHLPIFVQGPLNPTPHRDYLQKNQSTVLFCFFPNSLQTPMCRRVESLNS